MSLDDLQRDPLVKLQHRFYLPLTVFVSLFLPGIIAHYGWDDFWGGLFWAGFFRLNLLQHATFCINSVAHAFGKTTYDDVLTPRDSPLTALLTLGEGYHNFHHEFPNGK